MSLILRAGLSPQARVPPREEVVGTSASWRLRDLQRHGNGVSVAGDGLRDSKVLDNNRRCAPRNTTVGKLELISAAASDEKRRLINADRTTAPIGSNDLHSWLANCRAIRHTIRHKGWTLAAILTCAERGKT